MRNISQKAHGALVASLFTVAPVFAAETQDVVVRPGQTGSGVTQLQNPISANNLSDFLGKLIDIVLYLAVPVLVLAFIWVGFLFVLAQGNATKLSNAKTNLLYTLLGAAIIIGIKVIQVIIEGTVSTIIG